MEYIKINNIEYKFVVGNGKDDKYRASFNALTRKTFGFDFEQWYQDGHWQDQYIPYSIIDGEQVISNVSVNLMEMEIYGKQHHLIQLGTVMTDEAYRNQGLNRIILEKVIADWQDQCDYIYLFANDSVLDFYPKFGFKKINQSQCVKAIREKNNHSKNNNKSVKKLNMAKEEDRKLVYNKANKAISLAKISMVGNAELIMFYVTSFMKESVYYLWEYEAVVIANYNQDILEILGVFCEKEVSLDEIMEYFLSESSKYIKLYFTPIDTKAYTFEHLEEDTLFVLGIDKLEISDEQFMFPALSHT